MSEPAQETPFRDKGIDGWLINQARSAIRKKLGTDYDPEQLVQLLQIVCDNGDLTDTKVLDLAEMFIYLMDNELKWKLGAQIFRHYLNEGGLSNQELFLDSSPLLSSKEFRKRVCESQWEILKRAIDDRVSDTTGALFPRDRATGNPKPGSVTDDQGQVTSIVPAPSPLRAGGTETIFMETSVQLSSVNDSELAATFNRIGVVSKVVVTSVPGEDDTLDIDVSDWTTWAWDLCDFNPSDKPDIQFLPINVGTFFGPKWIEEKVGKILANKFEVSWQCLDQLIGFDKYMRQLADRNFERVNIVTGQNVHYFPKTFYARFSHWDFFAQTGKCDARRTYTITLAAPESGS